MCGIWSSLGFSPDRSHIDVVAHRGPDGCGWRLFDSKAGPLALGHRRLSIIDLSEAAQQPMGYADGRYWVVLNGEIYNYIELRHELAAAGHKFRTQSDTEVLLAAWAQWGDAALDRFVGMFAFVLWDDVAHSLIAARDPFGIKPLYVFATPQGIAFASEIKQFIGLPCFAARLNLARIYDFLSAGIVEHTKETLFADVDQLRGGECVRLDLRHWHLGDPLPVRRWYDIVEPGTLDISEEQAALRFGELLEQSVRLHLRSDVPLGTCLSGGLDSSSIIVLMARELSGQAGKAGIHSVSACYDVGRIDERRFMEAMVERVGSIPHWCYPKVDEAFAAAERITWHQDEPFGSTSIFAQWCVFAEARRAGLKVMLDGQGADEQLAGYHSCFPYYCAGLLRGRQITMLLRAMVERQAWHGVSAIEQIRNLVAVLLPPRWLRWLRRQRLAAAQHDWLAGDGLHAYLGNSALEVARASIGRPPIRGLGDLCLVLTRSASLNMLLHWEDRNSMAHGVEARVPFLDHRLVEFAIALGDRHKMVGGDTKRVLRRAMAGILPDLVRDRRDKLGFATPEAEWLRGPLREAVEEGIEQTLGRFPGLLNATGLRAHARDMLTGRRPIDFSLWRVVSLGIWGRIFAVTA